MGVSVSAAAILGADISKTVSPQIDCVKVSPASSSMELTQVFSLLFVSICSSNACLWFGVRFQG